MTWLIVSTPRRSSADFIAMFSESNDPLGNRAYTAATRRLGEGMWGSYAGSVFIMHVIEGDDPTFGDVTLADFRAGVEMRAVKLAPDMIALEQQMGKKEFDEYYIAEFAEVKFGVSQGDTPDER